MDDSNWLDALSDGKVLRHWLALFGQFFLGVLYFTLLVAGYATSIGLSFVLIGIPLLLFTLASTRTLADIDRRLMAAVLGVDVPRTAEDIDLRGAKLGERLGLLLGSALTYRSLLYLLLKLPIGVITFTASMILLPLMALELLILAPLTVDLHLLTARLLHWLAMGSYRAVDWLLPVEAAHMAEKPKRSRLELADDEEGEGDEGYYIDSEGEIQPAIRRAGR
ncbi:MAG: sensor domain-containing protein [Anaerolineae bacterium]|nr:sensor domain-containing protein [Anaerolineae bacterium]NUQ03799.1 sensor domain-containing protein [Anaerolineae bacterium]